MNQKMESRFKASMLGLSAGDVIIRNRNGKQQFSAVIKRHDGKGSMYFTISRFSPILSLDEYPKDVYLDEDGWLVDTSGAIVLLPEEWGDTEKEGAKALLSQRQEIRLSSSEKAKAILLAIRDRNTSFMQNAEVILEHLGQKSPSDESRMLLAFALWCAAKEIWNV